MIVGGIDSLPRFKIERQLMDDRIGLTPVPHVSDEELVDYLNKMILKNDDLCKKTLSQLFETIKSTIDKGEPEEFSYAKMLNYLASLPAPELVKLGAAALWWLRDIVEKIQDIEDDNVIKVNRKKWKKKGKRRWNISQNK